MDDLTTNLAAFCAVLRREHGFAIGQAEAHDALRAIEAVGVTAESRVRAALRLVCCGTREQSLAFDGAFDAFFRPPPHSTRQPAPAPTPSASIPADRPATDRPVRAGQPAATADEGLGETPRGREPAGNTSDDDAAAWQTLRARYSPAPAAAPAPLLHAHSDPAMLAAADRIIASLRLGRSRRWKPLASGHRFDVRRTLRASLHTGGDPVDLRYLGHPRRNPRIVFLIDGSRSMAQHTAGVLAFARALCERSARTSVFTFSTGLHDITRALRSLELSGGRLGELGEAWGGGTKIGANLDRFVARYGTRLLSPDTLVIIFSDGLDASDVPLLERAMRTIDRRAAGVIWLNPHADTPGYAPTARGIRAALPFIACLAAARDARGFSALADRVGTLACIAGRHG